MSEKTATVWDVFVFTFVLWVCILIVFVEIDARLDTICEAVHCEEP